MVSLVNSSTLNWEWIINARQIISVSRAILWGHHSNTETWQRHYNQRKLQSNVPYEYPQILNKTCNMKYSVQVKIILEIKDKTNSLAKWFLPKAEV